VLGEWTIYFAAHLNPGDHVVYRSVSTVLHGQVVRVVPGSAYTVEIQQPDGSTTYVSPADLIGLWDELSPAERGETFEIPTFGLARNPFDPSLERIETITLDFTDKPKADRAAAQAAPAAKPVVVKRPTGLPTDVPEVIEIDVGGRQPVWVLATIIRVAGSQLTCQRQDDQSTLKTPLYGRDIVWRVPSLVATPLAV
jgi:hypothetical protein